MYSGDTLVLYGRQNALQELNRRRDDPGGALAHGQTVSEQKDQEEREERRDLERRQKSVASSRETG